MKTAEELNALKEEVEKLNKKLAELTDEELRQVAGGKYPTERIECPSYSLYNNTPTCVNLEWRGTRSECDGCDAQPIYKSH